MVWKVVAIEADGEVEVVEAAEGVVAVVVAVNLLSNDMLNRERLHGDDCMYVWRWRRRTSYRWRY